MILGEKISGGGSSWSRDDDIAFERALAIYTDKTDSCWEKIAAVVPGKTLAQIREHYEILLHDVMMIESGCVPLPDYDISEETNDKEKSIGECGINCKCEYKQEATPQPKQQRRKGIAWTANEHRQFLLGLDKYGKGDWRSISRNFVVTRTPTQVASHAQKYFARLNSKNKNKRRLSIHDDNVADESRDISTMQRPTTTGQNTGATSQPSLDHRPSTPTTWKTPATSQPSLDHRPSTPTTWKTPATPQPSLELPVYGAPAMWNMQAASQPSVNIPMYGIGQPTVVPMLLPFGSDMNRLAPPCLAYGVQHHPIPYSFVPSAPFNMGSVPYNMAYLP